MKPQAGSAASGVQADPKSAADLPERSSRLAVMLAGLVLRLGRFSPIQIERLLKVGWIGRAGGRFFTARAADGVKLVAAWLPPGRVADPAEDGGERPSPLPSPSEGRGGASGASEEKPPVLLVHGWGQTLDAMRRHALLIRGRGHAVLLVDLRAHGRSGGRYITFGCHEREDLTCVLDEAARQGLIPGVGGVRGRIISLGLSLGAGTVLQHAAIDPRIVGVVALAPYRDMTTAVESYRRLYGPCFGSEWLRRGFAAAARRAGFDMAEASTLAAMPRLRVPALLAVGERDRNLSRTEHTHPLAAAAPPGICRLFIVPRSHHFNIHRRRRSGLDEVIQGFIEEVSRTAGAV